MNKPKGKSVMSKVFVPILALTGALTTGNCTYNKNLFLDVKQDYKQTVLQTETRNNTLRQNNTRIQNNNLKQNNPRITNELERQLSDEHDKSDKRNGYRTRGSEFYPESSDEFFYESDNDDGAVSISNGTLYFKGDKGIGKYNFSKNPLFSVMSPLSKVIPPTKGITTSPLTEKKFRRGFGGRTKNGSYKVIVTQTGNQHTIITTIDTKNNEVLGNTAILGGTIYDFGVTTQNDDFGREVPLTYALITDPSLGWANDEAQHEILGKDFGSFTTNQRLYNEGIAEMVDGRKMVLKESALVLRLFPSRGDGTIGLETTAKVTSDKTGLRNGQKSWYDEEIRPEMTYVVNSKGVKLEVPAKQGIEVIVTPVESNTTITDLKIYGDKMIYRVAIDGAKYFGESSIIYNASGLANIPVRTNGEVSGVRALVNSTATQTLEKRIEEANRP